MHFPSPVELDARDLVHRLAAPGAPRAVVGTACADTVTAEGISEGLLAEEALTLLLADIAVTVVCVYDPLDAAGVQVAHRSHPWLLTDEGRTVNSAYRPPATSSPVPAALVGPELLALSVPDGALLAAMRPQIAELARAEGLRDEQIDETVLVAHEALLVAGGACLEPGASPDLPAGDHQVLLRRALDGIVAECRGAPPEDQGRAEQVDRLHALSTICDGLTVHDGTDGRLVRALVSGASAVRGR